MKLGLSHPSTVVYEPWLDNTLGALSYAPIGAPDRRVGCLASPGEPRGPARLCGFVISVSYLCAEHAIYVLLAEPGSLPAGGAMVWIFSWSLPIIIGLTVFAFLKFAHRNAARQTLEVLGVAERGLKLAAVATGAFSSGALMGVVGPIRNPLGVEGLSGVYVVLLLYASLSLQAAAAFSVFVRLRGAAGA